MREAIFSSDGSKLIYSRGGPQSNIWRVPILSDRPATWADAQQLTFEQANLEFLDVSPDGQWLLFSSDRSGNQDLWKMPAGGGKIQQIATNPTPDWYPRWSPVSGRFKERGFNPSRTTAARTWTDVALASVGMTHDTS